MNARYITDIREALWKRPGRGACVMVGSGLSRQTAARPPSWGDLAELLQERLRCGAKKKSGRRGRTEPVTGRDCPRLAQEYKATFGQAALDKFLRSNVPDGEPGSAHERLLALPWADVFTTNWDTLLERASRSRSSRTYDVVVQPADLSTTVAPRIVKLHGSFPSNRPFVVTEEDYRTYPTRLAPFVNTVQQALMESTFLLVGFSGDDPNFLHWCGWVRDQLGPAAPTLYLAGLLDLDRPARRMLEDRGVVPIDLAPETSKRLDRDARHKRAMEWVLKALEEGEVQEQTWPVPPSYAKPATKIPKLPRRPAVQPLPEPAPPAQESDQAALTKAVRNVAKAWRHNRRVYPGWPILPFSKHQTLSETTARWVEPMLKVIPTLTPSRRLRVIRELLWRFDLLMDPVRTELFLMAKEALEAGEQGPQQTESLSGPGSDEVQQARVAVALSLLTHFRHELDQPGFETWQRKLATVVAPNSDAFHRLQHERSLWAMICQNLAELTAILNAWKTDDADLMWSLRKAALLVESGNSIDGRSLAQRTLQRAERAWARDQHVEPASRYGWALQWRLPLDLAQWLENTRHHLKSSPHDTDLWARLAPHDGDARSHWTAYSRQLMEEPRDDSRWTFELHAKNRVLRSDQKRERFPAAWRMIRLVELSGLPFNLPSVQIASDVTEKAAQIIGPFSRKYAFRLLLCGGTGSHAGLNDLLQQVHVAQMSEQEVTELFTAAQLARDFFIRRGMVVGSRDNLCWTKLELAIETVSRCLARHGVDGAVKTFRWAVQHRRPRDFPSYSLLKSIDRLVERSWNAMDLETQRKIVSEILVAPVLDGIFARVGDPGTLLSSEELDIRRSDAEESTWGTCVGQICAALRGRDEARGLAVGRLQEVVAKRLLTQAEEREVARNLWRGASRERTELPAARGVEDWVYLLLPEPELGMAEERFRAKWIGRDITEATSDTGGATIRNVANAWNPAHMGDRAIRLSADEEQWFWNFAAEWLDHERRVRPGLSGDGAMVELAEVLIRRGGPGSVLDGLVKSSEPVQDAAQTFAGLFERPDHKFFVIAACAALGGGGINEMESRLRGGLRSTDETVHFAAWQAFRWWIGNATLVKGVRLRAPSRESVGEIGVAISATREDGNIGPLEAACAVYENGHSDCVEVIHGQVLRGLRQLRSDLKYGSRVVGQALPRARRSCVWLAWTMTDAGKGDHDIVREWIKEGDEDPLCLVRFVRERYEASKRTAGGAADR